MPSADTTGRPTRWLPTDFIMISITRAQVPAYLVSSDFYASLSGEDSDEFDIPADNFKWKPEVENVEQLSQLLHTVRYWGVQNFTYSDSLIVYLSAVPPEEREKVAQLLKDFEWSSELAVWFTAFHALNQISPAKPDLVTNANALVNISPFLVCENETLRARSLAVLTAVASTSGDSAEPVSSAVSTSIAKLGNYITDETPRAFVRDVAKLLSRIFKYFDEEDATEAVHLLTRLLSWTDFAIIANACLAVFTFIENADDSNGPEEREMRVSLVMSMLPRLAELICCEVPLVQSAALRAVGAVCTGNDEQTQAALDLGISSMLVSMLQDPGDGTLKDVLWVINNLASGAPEQIQVLIDAGVFATLFATALSEEFVLNDEYPWIISGVIFAASREQLVYLVEIGVVRVICKYLRLLQDGDEGVMSMLESIEYLLGFSCGDKQHNPTMYDTVRDQTAECGGVEGIKSFVSAEDEDVQKLVKSLLKRYFPTKKRARA